MTSRDMAGGKDRHSKPRLRRCIAVALLSVVASLCVAECRRRILDEENGIPEVEYNLIREGGLDGEGQSGSKGKLWTGSPLHGALEYSKAGFECGDKKSCNWVYSDQTGPDGTCAVPKLPPIPYNENPTIAEFCGYYQTIPPWHWDFMYRNRTLLSSTVPNGAMYGCIVGSNWQSAEARRLPGWAGKGFDANSGRFSNLVQVMAYRDTGAYPGRFYPTYSQEGGLAWTLDYSIRSGIPVVGGVVDFVVDRLLPGQYIRNFGGFKDEIKEISRGVWLGRVYALPMMLSWDLSLGNISPFTVYTQVSFLLFQACL
mmetsp:Transcript_1580/g.3486  ORF Transcript_1580/g.3486 Transcript_1580/m.3486 type:complete len:313 (+) Transcript_1580:234-1172(+)